MELDSMNELAGTDAVNVKNIRSSDEILGSASTAMIRLADMRLKQNKGTLHYEQVATDQWTRHGCQYNKVLLVKYNSKQRSKPVIERRVAPRGQLTT